MKMLRRVYNCLILLYNQSTWVYSAILSALMTFLDIFIDPYLENTHQKKGFRSSHVYGLCSLARVSWPQNNSI